MGVPNVEGGGTSRIGAHLRFEGTAGAPVTEEIAAIDELEWALAYRVIGAAAEVTDFVGVPQLFLTVLWMERGHLFFQI